jgi:toxin ParE1/3/4
LKKRRVVFASRAKADLIELHDWIAERSSAAIAAAYLQRLEIYCQGFALAGERGHRRDDIRPGLRVVGFKRRIAIAFIVEAEQVIVLRLYYGGRAISSS